MDSHLSRSDLVLALSAGGDQSELDRAVPHLLACRACQQLAAGVVEELREASALVPLSDLWISLLNVFEGEERQVLDRLRSKGWWAELRSLAPEKQRERIRSVIALQTQQMFEVVLLEASLLASSDPHVGEETALAARLIAELLPRCTEKRKNDLQGRAMIVVANCRRLAADWNGSKTALQEAKMFLEHGTGNPRLEGNLLSFAASLASDTGNFEAALRMLAHAAECFRKGKDSACLSRTAVQEAGTLMAGLQFESAIRRAEEVLSEVTSRDLRLEMLARSIITECLIELNRPAQALRSYEASQPLYEQLGDRRTLLKVDYLEARLLDACGCEREAEKALREVIRNHSEEGFYKDAFIYTLTLFDSMYKRGALDKAARVCSEASRLLDTPFCHAQMKQVWENLLAQVKSQAVTVAQILEVRLYVQRHWNVPASRLQVGQLQVVSTASLQISDSLASSEPEADIQEPPNRPPADQEERSAELPELTQGDFRRSMEEHERKLLAAALQQTGGNVTATARLVGMSLTGLKSRIDALGLGPVVTRTRKPKAKGVGRRRRASYGPNARLDPR